MINIPESTLTNLAIDICEVLWNAGYSKAPVDVIMTLIGVPEEISSQYKGLFFSLNEPDFQNSLRERINERNRVNINNKTLH